MVNKDFHIQTTWPGTGTGD